LHLSQLPVNCATKTNCMKLKLYTVAGLIAFTGLVSCGGDNDKEVVDKSIIPTATDSAKAQAAMQNTVATPANTMPANTTVIPGTTAPINISPQTQTITQNQTITPNQQNNVVMTPAQMQPTVTAPGMNPPHGQPNHRCDIAVGAPLNSKPAAPATVQTATANAQPQVTMKEVPNTTKTAPGMNPPHGEPNHRCDIAVGAPLNSKPAAPATVTTPATIAAPPLLSTPKTDSTKN
jgi:hypothetical protein